MNICEASNGVVIESITSMIFQFENSFYRFETEETKMKEIVELAELRLREAEDKKGESPDPTPQENSAQDVKIAIEKGHFLKTKNITI